MKRGLRCGVCRRDLPTYAGPGRPRYAHDECRRELERELRGRDFSKLEIRTELRYRYCLANGGHAGSGRTIYRGGYTTLAICRRCEVPYGGREAVRWAGT